MYIPFDETGQKLFFSGTSVIVIKTITNKIMANIGENIYSLLEITPTAKISKEFDVDYRKTKSFPQPMNHPYKAPLFAKRLKKITSKQKHLDQIAINKLL